MPPSKDTKIFLEIEKSRIQREKAQLVLNKSIGLYFILMVISVLGVSFDYLDSFTLNMLVIIGIVILIAGTLPYLLIVHKEEKKIEGFLK